MILDYNNPLDQPRSEKMAVGFGHWYAARKPPGYHFAMLLGIYQRDQIFSSHDETNIDLAGGRRSRG